MNDNHIIIEIESEGSVSSSLRSGIYFESNSFLKITSLIEDSEIEGVYEDSFSGKTLLGGPSEALLLGKTYEGDGPIKNPMPTFVFTEVEVEVVRPKRERANILVKAYLGATGHEPRASF